MSTGRNYWRGGARLSARRIKHLLYGRLYWDRHRDRGRSVLVAGMARSGTTWLGDIITSQGKNRLLFEPFNPWPVGALRSPHYIRYMRPNEEDTELAAYCDRLFTGAIRHGWIDRQVDSLFPDGRVIKAVRANLLLAWMRHNFPEVSQVLIIRHPCAVVSSWLRLGWTADRDVAALLEQPGLVDDFLADKLDLIQQPRTREERIALMWCVNYMVPLQQPGSAGLHVLSYEDLIADPENEISRLFAAIRRPYDPSIFQTLAEPSATSKRKNLSAGQADRIGGWRKTLSADQVQRIDAVVAAFGLDTLNGEPARWLDEAPR